MRFKKKCITIMTFSYNDAAIVTYHTTMPQRFREELPPPDLAKRFPSLPRRYQPKKNQRRANYR